MLRLSRRRIVAGGGFGATVGAVGYGLLGRSEESPNRATVSSVYVHIVHERSHTVDLLIMDDETPIYMDSKTFEGAEDESDPSEVGGGHFENLPEEAGEYVIWLQLDGRRWDKFDFSENDELPGGWEEGEFPDAINVGYSIGHENRDEGSPAVSLLVYEADSEGSAE